MMNSEDLIFGKINIGFDLLKIVWAKFTDDGFCFLHSSSNTGKMPSDLFSNTSINKNIVVIQTISNTVFERVIWGNYQEEIHYPKNQFGEHPFLPLNTNLTRPGSVELCQTAAFFRSGN